MFNHIVAQLVDQYVQEFLGNWDPMKNLKIESVTEPEIHLTNVPLPQVVFDLAEIPLAVDYSNIASVHGRFSWGTFLGRQKATPIVIDLCDAEIRLRMSYPSEWNVEKWRNRFLKSKRKRADAWDRFVSSFAKHTVDKSLSQTLECRLVNALQIRARNIHVQIVDDQISGVPFAFELYIAEFRMDRPALNDPRLSELERDGLRKHLLSALWMRFNGMHLFYKELPRAVLTQESALGGAGSVSGRGGTRKTSMSIRRRSSLFSVSGSSDGFTPFKGKATKLASASPARGGNAISGTGEEVSSNDDSFAESEVNEERPGGMGCNADGPCVGRVKRFRVVEPEIESKPEPAAGTLPSSRSLSALFPRVWARSGSVPGASKKPLEAHCRPKGDASCSVRTSSRRSGHAKLGLSRSLGDIVGSFTRLRVAHQNVDGKNHDTSDNAFDPYSGAQEPSDSVEDGPAAFCATFTDTVQHGEVPPEYSASKEKENPSLLQRWKARFLKAIWWEDSYQNSETVCSSLLTEGLPKPGISSFEPHMILCKTNVERTCSLESSGVKHKEERQEKGASHGYWRKTQKSPEVASSPPSSLQCRHRTRLISSARSMFGPGHQKRRLWGHTGKHRQSGPSSKAESRNSRGVIRGISTTTLTRRGARRGRRMMKRSLKKSSEAPGETHGQRNILPPNDVAYRITDPNGLEMHILFKRWEIRALAALPLSGQRWKAVELSFIPHKDEDHYRNDNPEIILEGAETPPGARRCVCTPRSPQSSQGDYYSDFERKREGEGRIPASSPPLYGGNSPPHGPLALSFTAGSLEAFFNFIKYLDLWFVFLRGVARPIRQNPTREVLAEYFSLWKSKMSGTVLEEAQQVRVQEIEDMLPLYALFTVRDKAEAEVWASMGLARLARHLRGHVRGVCQTLFQGFRRRGASTLEESRPSADCSAVAEPVVQATAVDSSLRNAPKDGAPSLPGGTSSGRRCCFLCRPQSGETDTTTQITIPVTGITQPEAKSTEDELFTRCTGNENRFCWFLRDSCVEVVLPDVRCEMLPSIPTGRHIQGKPLGPLSMEATAGKVIWVAPHRRVHHQPSTADGSASRCRDSFRSSAEKRKMTSRLSRIPEHGLAHLGTAPAFVVCMALRYISEKTNDHTKQTQVLLDHLTVFERPVDMVLYRSSNAFHRAYPDNPQALLPVPRFLIVSHRIQRAPIRVVIASVEAYSDLNHMVARLSLQDDVTTTECLHFDDHQAWEPFVRSSPTRIVQQCGMEGHGRGSPWFFVSTPADVEAPLLSEQLPSSVSQGSLATGNRWIRQTTAVYGWKNAFLKTGGRPPDAEGTVVLRSGKQRKPIVYPPSRMSVVIADTLVAGLKKTLVCVPHCVVDVGALLSLASCFPPKFHVHVDFFHKVDRTLPPEVSEAWLLGHKTSAVSRPVEIQISRTYAIVESSLYQTMRLGAFLEPLKCRFRNGAPQRDMTVPTGATNPRSSGIRNHTGAEEQIRRRPLGHAESEAPELLKTCAGDTSHDLISSFFRCTPNFTVLRGRKQKKRSLLKHSSRSVVTDATRDAHKASSSPDRGTSHGRQPCVEGPLVEALVAFASEVSVLLETGGSVCVSIGQADITAVPSKDYVPMKNGNPPLSVPLSPNVAGERGLHFSKPSPFSRPVRGWPCVRADRHYFALFPASLAQSMDGVAAQGNAATHRKEGLFVDAPPTYALGHPLDALQDTIRLLSVTNVTLKKTKTSVEESDTPCECSEEEERFNALLTRSFSVDGLRGRRSTSTSGAFSSRRRDSEDADVDKTVTTPCSREGSDNHSSNGTERHGQQRLPQYRRQGPSSGVPHRPRRHNAKDHPSQEAFRTRLELGIDSVLVGVCEALTSVVCHWKTFVFEDVDFGDILHRLRMFTSFRYLHPKTHQPLPETDLKLFSPTQTLNPEMSSHSWEEEAFLRELATVPTGLSPSLSSSISWHNEDAGMRDAMWNKIPNRTTTSMILRRAASSLLSQASDDNMGSLPELDVGLGCVSCLFYLSGKARMGVQLFSSYFRTAYVNPLQSPVRVWQALVSEIHVSDMWLLGSDQFFSSIVVTKNTAHVGLSSGNEPRSKKDEKYRSFRMTQNTKRTPVVACAPSPPDPKPRQQMRTFYDTAPYYGRPQQESQANLSFSYSPSRTLHYAVSPSSEGLTTSNVHIKNAGEPGRQITGVDQPPQLKSIPKVPFVPESRRSSTGETVYHGQDLPEGCYSVAPGIQVYTDVHEALATAFHVKSDTESRSHEHRAIEPPKKKEGCVSAPSSPELPAPSLNFGHLLTRRTGTALPLQDSFRQPYTVSDVSSTNGSTAVPTQNGGDGTSGSSAVAGASFLHGIQAPITQEDPGGTPASSSSPVRSLRPAAEVLTRFGVSTIPHITLTYQPPENDVDTTYRICVALRSFFVCLSPRTVDGFSRIITCLKKDVLQELNRGAVIEAQGQRRNTACTDFAVKMSSETSGVLSGSAEHTTDWRSNSFEECGRPHQGEIRKDFPRNVKYELSLTLDHVTLQPVCTVSPKRTTGGPCGNVSPISPCKPSNGVATLRGIHSKIRTRSRQPAFGWPSVISVSQLVNAEARKDSSAAWGAASRAAVLDFDGIGIRLFTSLHLTLVSGKDRRVMSEHSGTRSAGATPLSSQINEGSFSNELGLQMTFRRYEMNLIRNGSWLMASTVIPNMVCSVKLSVPSSTVAHRPKTSGTRPTPAVEKAVAAPTHSNGKTFDGRHSQKKRKEAQLKTKKFSVSSKTMFSFSLKLSQMFVWQTTYWDSGSSTPSSQKIDCGELATSESSSPRNFIKRGPLSLKPNASKVDGHQLYPAPLSFGLCWTRKPLTVTNPPAFFDNSSGTPLFPCYDELFEHERIASCSAKTQELRHNAKWFRDEATSCTSRPGEAPGNENKSPVSSGSWFDTTSDSLSDTGVVDNTTIFCTIEEQMRLLRSEDWCDDLSALLLPSPPPFARHVTNPRGALSPIIYIKASPSSQRDRSAVFPSNDVASSASTVNHSEANDMKGTYENPTQSTRKLLMRKKCCGRRRRRPDPSLSFRYVKSMNEFTTSDFHTFHMYINGSQSSWTYGYKKDQNLIENTFSHMFSFRMAPATLLVDPVTVQYTIATMDYLSLWFRRVKLMLNSSRLANVRDPGKNHFFHPSPEYTADRPSEPLTLSDGDAVVQKLSSVPHAVEKLERLAKDAVKGNVYFDAEITSLRAIMVNVDTFVQVPKVKASLLTQNLPHHVVKKYTAATNSISLESLEHFDILCLAQEKLPTIEIDFRGVLQVVSTRPQDCVPLAFHTTSPFMIGNNEKPRDVLHHSSAHPARTTPFPPLIALLSLKKPGFGAPSQLPWLSLGPPAALGQDFFAVWVHIPVFSVTLARTCGVQHASRGMNVTTFLQEPPPSSRSEQPAPSASALQCCSGSCPSTPCSSQSLQFILTFVEARLYKTAEPGSLSFSLLISRIIFSDKNNQSFFSDTSSVRRLVHQFQATATMPHAMYPRPFVTPGLPGLIGDLGRIRDAPSLADHKWTDEQPLDDLHHHQFALHLLLGQRRVASRVNLSDSRFLVDLNFLPMLICYVRDILQVYWDFVALDATYPPLEFQNSTVATARVSHGPALLAFAHIAGLQKKLPEGITYKPPKLSHTWQPIFPSRLPKPVQQNGTFVATLHDALLSEPSGGPLCQEVLSPLVAFQFPLRLICYETSQRLHANSRPSSEDSQESLCPEVFEPLDLSDDDSPSIFFRLRDTRVTQLSQGPAIAYRPTGNMSFSRPTLSHTKGLRLLNRRSRLRKGPVASNMWASPLPANSSRVRGVKPTFLDRLRFSSPGFSSSKPSTSPASKAASSGNKLSKTLQKPKYVTTEPRQTPPRHKDSGHKDTPHDAASGPREGQRYNPNNPTGIKAFRNRVRALLKRRGSEVFTKRTPRPSVPIPPYDDSERDKRSVGSNGVGLSATTDDGRTDAERSSRRPVRQSSRNLTTNAPTPTEYSLQTDDTKTKDIQPEPWAYMDVAPDATVSITCSFRSIELWVLPFTADKIESTASRVQERGSDIQSPTAYGQFAAHHGPELVEDSHEDDSTESTSSLTDFSLSDATSSQSVLVSDLRGTPNVIHPNALVFQTLQTLLESIHVGHLTGEIHTGSGGFGSDPVLGILLAVNASASKIASESLTATVHIMELNVLMGHPQLPHVWLESLVVPVNAPTHGRLPSSSVWISMSPQKTPAEREPEEKPIVGNDTVANRARPIPELFSKTHRLKESPRAKRASFRTTTNSFVDTILPPVLVGFEGALFVSNLGPRAKKDCLFTLNSARLHFHKKGTSPPFYDICQPALIEDAEIANVVFNFEQPELHFSFDTLRSVHRLHLSLLNAGEHISESWATYPATPSLFVLQLALLDATQRYFGTSPDNVWKTNTPTAEFAGLATAEFSAGDSIEIALYPPGTKKETAADSSAMIDLFELSHPASNLGYDFTHLEGEEDRANYFDVTALTQFPDDMNSLFSSESWSASDSSPCESERSRITFIDSLAPADDHSNFLGSIDKANSLVCTRKKAHGQLRSSSPLSKRVAQSYSRTGREHSWFPQRIDGGHNGMPTFSEKQWARQIHDSNGLTALGASQRAAPQRPFSPQDDMTTTLQNETLDHKILRFFFRLCSRSNVCVIVNFSFTITEASLNLHDEYVQLLQIRITDAFAKGMVPLAGCAALECGIALCLTSYNPLISGMERLLDSVGVRFTIQRKFAGTSGKEVKGKEVFQLPWLDITLQMDRLGLDISTGSLQIFQRLYDLMHQETNGENQPIGKMKTVTIFNDTGVPMILLQNAYQDSRNSNMLYCFPQQQTWPALRIKRQLATQWRHKMLFNFQCCTAATQMPVWFAVQRYSNSSKGSSKRQMFGSPNHKPRKLRFFRHRNGAQEVGNLTPRTSPATPEECRAAPGAAAGELETEEDIRRMAAQLLRLGSRREKHQLNSFFKLYKKYLLFGTTRSVELLLQLFADQLPFPASNAKHGGSLSSIAHIFDLLRNEPGWSSMGLLRPDYQTQRGYLVPESGFNVVVEPAGSAGPLSVDEDKHTRRVAGEWNLCVGTSVQIANLTNIPFKISMLRRFGAVQRFARRLHREANERLWFNGTATEDFTMSNHISNTVSGPTATYGGVPIGHNRIQASHDIVVSPQTRRSVPLAWFFSSRIPFIVPLVGDERPVSLYSQLKRELFKNHYHSQRDHPQSHHHHHHQSLERHASHHRGSHHYQQFKSRRAPYVSSQTRSNQQYHRTTQDVPPSVQRLLTPHPFHILHQLLLKLSQPQNVTEGVSGTSRKHETFETCTLRFRKHIAWNVSVTLVDIPTNIPDRVTCRYLVKISPYFTLKNALPYPVAVRIYPNRTSEKESHKEKRRFLFRGTPSEWTAAEDVCRLLLNCQTMAVLPPQHHWQIPWSLQTFSFRVSVYGCPIEPLTTPVMPLQPCDVQGDLETNTDILRPPSSTNGTFATGAGALRPFTALQQPSCTSATVDCTPVYGSGRINVWLPVSDTSTTGVTLFHKPRTFLEDVPFLHPLYSICQDLLSATTAQPITRTFDTFNITADISRQLVTLFAPYFIENACRDVVLLFQSKPVPCGCRLYVAEEEAKVARVRVLRQDARYSLNDPKHLQTSSASGRLDLQSTAATRPPICLRFKQQTDGVRKPGPARHVHKTIRWAGQMTKPPFRKPYQPRALPQKIQRKRAEQQDTSPGKTGNERHPSLTRRSITSKRFSRVAMFFPQKCRKFKAYGHSRPSQKPVTDNWVNANYGNCDKEFGDRFSDGLLEEHCEASQSYFESPEPSLVETQESNTFFDSHDIPDTHVDIDRSVSIPIAEELSVEYSDAENAVSHAHPHANPSSRNILQTRHRRSIEKRPGLRRSTPISRFWHLPTHSKTQSVEEEVSKSLKMPSPTGQPFQHVPVHATAPPPINIKFGAVLPDPDSTISAGSGAPGSTYTPLLGIRNTQTRPLTEPPPEKTTSHDCLSTQSARLPLSKNSGAGVNLIYPRHPWNKARHPEHDPPPGGARSGDQDGAQPLKQRNRVIEPLHFDVPLDRVLHQTGSAALGNRDTELESSPGNPFSHHSQSTATYNVASLALSVRYASAPYTVSKVVTFSPRYYFFSRLPFFVTIKDVKSSHGVKLGVGSHRASLDSQAVLTLYPGECLPFHTSETFCVIQKLASNQILSCSPFSLVPSHVPTSFQVELTFPKLLEIPNGQAKASDGPNLQQSQEIVQVNIVSGAFSEQHGSRASLPYTYNGIFLVLTIPEYFQFQLVNLTRYALQYAPSKEKLISEVHTSLPVSSNRTGAEAASYSQSVPNNDPTEIVPAPDTSLQTSSTTNSAGPPPQLTQAQSRMTAQDASFLSRPEASSVCRETRTTAGGGHHRLSYSYLPPPDMLLHRKRLAPGGLSRTGVDISFPKHLYPGQRVAYVPLEKGSKIAVRLRVANTHASTWKLVSLTTVHTAPTLIPFTERQAPAHSTKRLGPSVGGGGGRARRVMFHEDTSPGGVGWIPFDAGTTPTGGGALFRRRPTTDARRSTNDTRREPATSMAGPAVPTTPSVVSVVPNTHKETPIVRRQLYAFLTVNCRGSRILTITESRNLVESLKAGQVVHLPNSISSNSTQGHRMKPTLNTQRHSTNPCLLEQQRSSLETTRPQSPLSPRERPTDPPAYELQLPWIGINFTFSLPKITLTWTSQSELVLALHLSSICCEWFAAPTRFTAWTNDIWTLRNALASASLDTGYSDSQLQSSYNDQINTHEATPSSIQRARGTAPDPHELSKRYRDLQAEIFTNSDLCFNLSIAAIHCDHFVEGDIPVILKSTNAWGSNNPVAAPFFYVSVSKRIVDPTFAPIYDTITISLSPLAANVELAVVEQLIALGEKEYALMHSAVRVHHEKALPKRRHIKDGLSPNFHKLEVPAFSSYHHDSTTARALATAPHLVDTKMDAAWCPIHFNCPDPIPLLDACFIIDCYTAQPKGAQKLPNSTPTTSFECDRGPFLMTEIELTGSPRGGRLPTYSREYSRTRGTTPPNSYIVPMRRLLRHLEQECCWYHMKKKYFIHLNTQCSTCVATLYPDQKLNTSDEYPSHPETCPQLTTFIKEKHNLLISRYARLLSGRRDSATAISRRPYDAHSDAREAFKKHICVTYTSDISPASHLLVFPHPRWVELKTARPVYIKALRINSFLLTISIRTSNKRISRQVLHIVDALPLDTPYMGLQINAEKRVCTVCTWGELLHSLRNSYLRQLIRQTLPSAWLFNPFAFATGTWRGGRALLTATVHGARSRRMSGRRFSLEGSLAGFRLGFVVFFLYTAGGIFQTCSHFGNLVHKAMGGSRPRPQGVLDAIWKGFNGFLEDTLVTPWVALYVSPATAISRGDGFCKTLAIFVGCLLRCLTCVVFGFFNLFTSVTEGFANALIGDFEQFTRMQEQSDFIAKNTRRAAAVAELRERSNTVDAPHHRTAIPGIAGPSPKVGFYDLHESKGVPRQPNQSHGGRPPSAAGATPPRHRPPSSRIPHVDILTQIYQKSFSSGDHSQRLLH